MGLSAEDTVAEYYFRDKHHQDEKFGRNIQGGRREGLMNYSTEVNPAIIPCLKRRTAKM